MILKRLITLPKGSKTGFKCHAKFCTTQSEGPAFSPEELRVSDWLSLQLDRNRWLIFCVKRRCHLNGLYSVSLLYFLHIILEFDLCILFFVITAVFGYFLGLSRQNTLNGSKFGCVALQPSLRGVYPLGLSAPTVTSFCPFSLNH